jgi:hypothetical protein
MRESLRQYIGKIQERSPEYPDILIRRIAQLVQQIKIETSDGQYQKYGMNPWILKRFRCVLGEINLPEDELLKNYLDEIDRIEIEF